MAQASGIVQTSLPLTTLECKVCFELVDDAVHCMYCKKFICKRHVDNLPHCPFCRKAPFNVEIDYSIRDLVDQLPIGCPFCQQCINKGDLNIHTNHCPQRPRKCGVNGCDFQTGNKEEALRHVIEFHGDTLWDNYNKLTSAVGNGVESVCAVCLHFREQNAALTRERDVLQHQKNQLEWEKNALKSENKRLCQKNLQFEMSQELVSLHAAGEQTIAPAGQNQDSDSSLKTTIASKSCSPFAMTNATDAIHPLIRNNNDRQFTSLTLSRRIPGWFLHGTSQSQMLLNGVICGASEHELFTADVSNNVVHSFDLRAEQLNSNYTYRPPEREKVKDVAYGAETDTLFIATLQEGTATTVVIIRSFSRTSAYGSWTLCHSIQLDAEKVFRAFLRVLCDGSIFCGQWDTDWVHMCHVNEDRLLRQSARLVLPTKHEGFDVQLVVEEKRLVASLLDGSVAIFSVYRERALQLSRVQLPCAGITLFCGDTLLVGIERTRFLFRKMVSFAVRVSDGLLERDRTMQLLPPEDDKSEFFSWCFVNTTAPTLLVWEKQTQDLFMYSMR